MKSKLVSLLTSAVILSSCASNHRKTSAQIRQMVMANQHAEAIALLKESSLATDKNSQLLYFIELGLLEHYRGNYPASIEALNSAKSISDELYTTRISGKLKTILSNDNADFFYGEKYEASLIYFYLSLNHYMQAELELDPAKKKALLMQARSEVLGWDSFLTEIKNERLGKAFFKEDLLAKTFGAFIHEAQGSNQDDQIALQLYKDAGDVFFKNYNLFPTFNGSFKSFRENFSNLHKLPLKEVEGKYVLATEHNSAFQEFLTMKILLLTKKIKPQDLKTQVAKLKPSEAVLQKLKTGSGNVTFLVQDGLIVEKIAQKYEFPIQWSANHASFAFMMGMGSKISFELPAVSSSPSLEQARLQALNIDGTVASEAPLSVIAPLGDLAEQAINEHSSAIAAKTAARVAGKHIAALVATSAAYQMNKQKNPGIALMVATLGHAAAIAAINESEKADLRFWGTLPSNIRMGNLSLPVGTYKFRAVFGVEGATEYRVIELGEQAVGKGTLKFVMNNKHLKYRARNLANADEPKVVVPENAEQLQPKTTQVQPNPNVIPTPAAGCMKDAECPQDTVCATVRGEYPGSCAGTGFFGGIGRNISGNGTASTSGCMNNTDCPPDKVCATVRGEYPGSCAGR